MRDEVFHTLTHCRPVLPEHGTRMWVLKWRQIASGIRVVSGHDAGLFCNLFHPVWLYDNFLQTVLCPVVSIKSLTFMGGFVPLKYTRSVL